MQFFAIAFARIFERVFAETLVNAVECVHQGMSFACSNTVEWFFALIDIQQ